MTRLLEEHQTAHTFRHVLRAVGRSGVGLEVIAGHADARTASA